MEISFERQADAVVARVHQDRIDAASAIQFKDRMRDLGPNPASRVVLDLAAVDFLDSSGLGAVVAVMKMLGPDCRLELAGLTDNVARVFRLTRMDSVFTILDAAPTAIQDAG